MDPPSDVIRMNLEGEASRLALELLLLNEINARRLQSQCIQMVGNENRGNRHNFVHFYFISKVWRVQGLYKIQKEANHIQSEVGATNLCFEDTSIDKN